MDSKRVSRWGWLPTSWPVPVWMQSAVQPVAISDVLRAIKQVLAKLPSDE